MAQKKPLSDEELLAQLDGISGQSARAAKPAPAPAAGGGIDALAELEKLESLAKAKGPAAALAAGGSRPHSPKPGGGLGAAAAGSVRNSEDRSRRSAESSSNTNAGLTPSSEAGSEAAPPPQLESTPQAAGGGWWGGLLATAASTATAAVKQAEAAYKEIQQNQEAQRWADQVRGNVGALRNLGGELGSRAIPTFTDILHSIAPPISQHERLQIHITHDLLGYPALDPTVHAVFSRVMAQVEGGDLLVIQRGSESRGVSGAGASRSGWGDGPWWRDGSTKRSMGAVAGLVEGTKLARAGAEAFAHEHFAPRGGLDEAVRLANEGASEANPVRSSDIFLAIQAVHVEAEPSLFQAAKEDKGPDGGVVDEEPARDELVCFAVYLHDPVHSIALHAVTQAIPRKWAEWLDAAPSADADAEPARVQLPDEIADIVVEGGIDPREWVSEWVEEVIGLGVGVVAQRYVAKRMGVGEGGIGRGKRLAVEAGAGELARAL